MAINSAEKRRAASGLVLPLGPGVTPNVSKDAEWRGEVGRGYPFVAAIVPPSAPTNLTAVAGDAQITLSWNSSSGAVTYNLYRSTISGGETLVQTGISATSFIDTVLTNGVTYFYQVSAVNADGESGLSSEASATPQAVAPAPVGQGGGSLGGGVPSYHHLFQPIVRRRQPESRPEKKEPPKERSKRKRKLRPVLVELKTATVPGITDDDFFALLLMTDFDFATAEILADSGVTYANHANRS